MLKLTKRPKTPYWIIRGTLEGKRIEKSTGCSRKADAIRFLERFQRQETSDQIGEAGLMFFQATAVYLDQLGRREQPLYLDRMLARFGQLPVSHFTNGFMRQQANAMFPDLAPATVRRHFYTPIRAIINAAADDDLCPPCPRFRAPSGDNRRTEFLLPDQAERLIAQLAAHPNPAYAGIATLIIGQGLRSGECYALQWPDVHLDQRFAMIRDTKTGVERSVTLIPRVIAMLSRQPTRRTGGNVFLRSNETPFPVRSEARGGGFMRRQYNQAARAANVPDSLAKPHILRHTWATWYNAQTKDTRGLIAEGGWASNEWLRYTKIGTPTLGQEAAEYGWNFKVDHQNEASRIWGKIGGANNAG